MTWLKKYDVFISYAIEDKESVAEHLASSLEKSGLRVYYVGRELQVGDEISQVISTGLKSSRYFIMVLSPYYKRKWTIVEGHRFIQKEKDENKTLIFPVWHNINLEEAKLQYPELADRYAIGTEKGMETIADNLYKAIRHKQKKELFKRSLKLLSLLGFFSYFVFSALPYYKTISNPVSTRPLPPRAVAEIQKRIQETQARLKAGLLKQVALEKGKPFRIDSIIKMYYSFQELGTREEIRYSFSFRDRVLGEDQISELGIVLSKVPFTGYGFTSLSAYLLPAEKPGGKNKTQHLSFIILNETPVEFSIDTFYSADSKLHAAVLYEHYIRSIRATLSYSPKTGLRTQQIDLAGYPPGGEYIFQKQKLSWTLQEEK